MVLYVLQTLSWEDFLCQKHKIPQYVYVRITSAQEASELSSSFVTHPPSPL